MHLSLWMLLAVSAVAENDVAAQAQALGVEALRLGAESRGAAPLIRLHGMIDEVDELNLLAEPFASLLYRRSTHPHVRTLARRFMSDVERARGQTVKASNAVDELQFIQDWHVVGSFDNEGKGGCDTDFGPESGLDLDASYAGKGRELAWHATTAQSADGYVDVSLLAKPATEGVAYALTFLEASRESSAIFSIGTSGAFRLFLNGSKVAQSNRYNQPRPDQNRLLVPLRKGLNRVLLKICQEKGQYGFYFRSERAPGAAGTIRVARQAKVPPLERGRPASARVLPTLVDEVERLHNLRPSDAALTADLATIVEFTKSFDDTEKRPGALSALAADLRPDDVNLQWVAAQLNQDDVNLAHRFLQRGLSLEPNHVFLQAAVASLDLTREHPERALAQVNGILERRPKFPPALLLKASAQEALGERMAAGLTVEEALQKCSKYPQVVRAALANSRRWLRLDEVRSRAQVALGLRFADLDSRKALAAVLLEQRALESAVEQLEKVLVLDPLDVGTHLRLAELLSANGKTEAGDAHFAAALTLSPDEAEVHERKGRALLLRGASEAGAAALAQALKLRPQNPAVRELLRASRGDDAGPNNPYAFAAAPLLEQAKAAASNDDALILAESTLVRVQVSGLSSRYAQLVVKPLTQRGVETFRQLSIPYAPDRQESRVLKVRITKPDGSIVESFEDEDRTVNEPWSGMYYDSRLRLLTFPALAPGDVLEVQYKVEDTSIENLLADYWGDVEAISGAVVKKHFRYAVEMPATRPLYFNQSGLPKWVKYTQTPNGDKLVHVFEADEVKKIVSETNMPGWAEVANPLHLSTYANWDDVGRFYWGLVRDQLTPNDELKSKVNELLRGVDRTDTRKVVAALYGFVVKNTRYVALEFGIHGFKPYRVDRVLARRFGDCKDKASLLWAMLSVAQIDARLVLLRMRHLGLLSPEPASLSAFNHAIVYVPSIDLYLDGTAEYHGSTELPAEDRLANALVVEPTGKSRFVVTPESLAKDNGTDLTLAVTLNADGSATAAGSEVFRGQFAPQTRKELESDGTRMRVFEQQWAQAFPGISATQVTLAAPTVLEQPAKVDFAVRIPRYAEASATRLKFFSLGASRIYTQALAALPKRGYPAVLSGVFQNHYQVTYTAPKGYQPGVLPERADESSAFGTFYLECQVEGDVVKVVGELTLLQSKIQPGEYAAFRSWLMRVDQAFSRKLVFDLRGETASTVK